MAAAFFSFRSKQPTPPLLAAVAVSSARARMCNVRLLPINDHQSARARARPSSRLSIHRQQSAPAPKSRRRR